MRVCGATTGSRYSLLTCELRITVDHLFQTILTRLVCIACPYYTARHCSPSHTVPDVQPCRRIVASARPLHDATSHLRQMCVCVRERGRVEGIVIFLFHCFVLLNKINEYGFIFYYLFFFAAFFITNVQILITHTSHSTDQHILRQFCLFVLCPFPPLFSFPSLPFFVSLIFPFLIFIYHFSLLCFSSRLPFILPSLTVIVIVRSFHPPPPAVFLLHFFCSHTFFNWKCTSAVL